MIQLIFNWLLLSTAQKLHQESSFYNQEQAGGKNQGLQSPSNVFLYDDEQFRYFTTISLISSFNGIEKEGKYKVALEIDLPFIFITELNNSLHFTKLIPTDDQIELIISYIKPKFKEIEDCWGNIFYVLNSSLWINQNIGLDVSFFYYTGYGAIDFRQSTMLDGYIGLGKYPSVEKGNFNYIMNLTHQHLISHPSYSLYFGNQEGFIDSVITLGNYQESFKQNGTEFQQLKAIPGCNQTWCFRVNQISLYKNDTTIYSSSNRKPYTSFISSTYQFIYMPREIAEAIKFHIQKNDNIDCDFINYPIQNRNNTILICSTKLQISIPQNFPVVEFVVLQHSQKITLTFNPQQYIQKCLDDVETYEFKCLTYFAIYDKKIDQYKPNFDIVFGLPFLRVYYTYYDLQNSTILFSQAYQFDDIPLISRFWYYSFLALLICWALVMMSCGIFFKEQMDQMIVFVINILKYIQGDQQARQQVLRNYLGDD
ncbi:unnamed protein product [Paramecium pentaurelia]|uniref:Peptidase A1 domain-containing protein n=1 Tax=Paramecium pentaurelia TaxID=43138 RepID=A0A8S1SHP6_9CILI|nr:unnamed protein product [Paramecium pentaurelia]